MAILRRLFVLCMVSVLFSFPSFAASQGRWFDRIVIVFLENANFEDVVKDANFKALAREGTLFTNYGTIAHPSYPNYMAFVGGDTFGIKSDKQVNLSGKSTIADLLEQKALDWRAYAEDYPGNCFLRDSSGSYARKHVPFLSFTEIQRDKARCAKVTDFRALDNELRANTLPAFSLVIPNLKNDGHDTSIAVASAWAKAFMEKVKASPAYANTLFVITYDESEGLFTKKNIFTLFLGDMVKAGAESPESSTHYGLLRTIEDNFSLGNLGRNDRSADVLTSAWK